MRISPEYCYVVVCTGFMLQLSISDEIFYEGDSPSDRDRARVAAEACVAERSARCPSLTFYACTLSDYFSQLRDDARDEGERAAIDRA